MAINISNLVLIGMSGAGKSTVGALVAKMIGYEFIDLDVVMEQAERETRSRILERLGSDGYCNLESTLVQRLAGANHKVIAPGGSVIYRVEAMQALRALGHVIFRDVPLAELKRRGVDDPTRAIVNPGNEPYATLVEGRGKRYAYWADTILPCGKGASAEDIAKQIFSIMQRVRENVPAHC